jgi:hypothetical protein
MMRRKKMNKKPLLRSWLSRQEYSQDSTQVSILILMDSSTQAALVVLEVQASQLC